MRRRYWGCLCCGAVLLCCIAAAPTPRFLEELAIGGGLGDAVDGGAILERDGDILTDGKVSAGASTMVRASVKVPHGVAPGSPEDGDLWSTSDGFFARVNGLTYGPLIDSSGVPWATPGAIGSTTPNSGSFTTGSFNANITISGSSPTVKAVSGSQFLISHGPTTGDASIRFSPEADDGTSAATVDIFRQTNTTGYVAFLIKRGNGSNTSVFEVKASSATPATYFRDSGGAPNAVIHHESGDVESVGNGLFGGGAIAAGADATTRGVVTAWDGGGGTAPGVLQLASPNGSIWNVFVEDDGTLKVHTALPTQNADGTVVGSQS